MAEVSVEGWIPKVPHRIAELSVEGSISKVVVEMEDYFEAGLPSPAFQKFLRECRKFFEQPGFEKLWWNLRIFHKPAFETVDSKSSSQNCGCLSKAGISESGYKSEYRSGYKQKRVQIKKQKNP